MTSMCNHIIKKYCTILKYNRKFKIIVRTKKNT